MPLTAVSTKNAKPCANSYRLCDGRGLYLEVAPRGGKWWHLKYRIDGREKRDEVRKHLASGIDPSAARKAAKEARVDRAANTFKLVALEWHAKHASTWSDGHAQ